MNEQQPTAFEIGWDNRAPDANVERPPVPYFYVHTEFSRRGRSLFAPGVYDQSPEGTHGRMIQQGTLAPTGQALSPLLSSELIHRRHRRHSGQGYVQFTLSAEDLNDFQLLHGDTLVNGLHIYQKCAAPFSEGSPELWMFPVSRAAVASPFPFGAAFGFERWWSVRLPSGEEKPLRWWLERLVFPAPSMWRLIG